MDYLQYIKEQQLLPEDSLEFLQLQSYLQRFQNGQYGEGHALFTAMAAFPVFLTPELLYKLWLNFQAYRDEAGDKRKIHRIAVSDLLLSGLLRELAVDIYEIQPSIRTALLSCLEKRFREKRNILRELAEFILYYVRSYQLEGESVTTAVREAQEWNALAYVDPAAAVRQIREALSGSIAAGSPTRQLRINLLLQRLDQQYSHTNRATGQLGAFRTLVDYSQGMSEFIQGKHRKALQRFRNLEQRAPLSSTGGTNLKQVKMPIPKAIYEGLQQPSSETESLEQSQVFALFVGIDRYTGLPPLKGSIQEANEMAYLISQLIPKERLQSNTVLDAAAHKKLILGNWQDYLQQAREDDVVLFYFAGHGENLRQNALLLTDYHREKNPEEAITAEEFQQLIKDYATNNPFIVLILDTATNGENWLPPNSEQYLVLTAGKSETIAFEAQEAGAFSRLLREKLNAKNGAVTYQQLIGEVREVILSKSPRLPEIFGAESAALRLFLHNAYSPAPRIQELLREAGYYEGPIGEEHRSAAEEALRRFTEDWQVEAEPMKAVQQKILADQRKELRVLTVGGQVSEPVDAALAELLENRSFPIRPEIYQPPDPQALAAQKYQALESEVAEAAARRVDEADFIILLLDDALLQNEASRAVTERIRQWRQTRFLPVVPLLIRDCDWQRHPVAQLPEMALYRKKGNFLEPEWIAGAGMKMIREGLEGIGWFMITEEQRRYRKLCEHFDPAMSNSELQPVREGLLKAGGALKNIDFVVPWLKPDTSRQYLFGALCALEAHPDGIEHFQELESLLSRILKQDQLTGLQMSILAQLAQTFDKILERNEQESTPLISERQQESLLGLLHRLLQSEQVQADKAEHGPDSLCAFLYGLIHRVTRLLGSSLANYCFEKGLLSEALSLSLLIEEVNLPQPIDAPLQYLTLCEQFDGDMSVRDMDRLGNQLQSQAASIPDFHFLVDRLRPSLFQGYIFGAARAIEAQPEVDYYGPLLGYLDRISQTEDLNYDNLRLRVLYRMLMGLENIVENDNQKDSPEIDPEMRMRTISVLEAIHDNPRAGEDTRRHKGKGIGGRIEQVIGKLRPQEEAVQTETMESSAETESVETDGSLLRRALFELDFTAQLEVAQKEVDIGAMVIPVIAPVNPAAGPGLLRDRLCSEFDLPPEWLVTANLAETAAYGWSETVLIRDVLNQLHLRSKKEDLEEFVELLSKEYAYEELVFSLESQGSLSMEKIAEFTNGWLGFADQLARTVSDKRVFGGLRRVWLFLFLDELPPSFPPKEDYNWWTRPVILPPVELVSDKELEQWIRNLPEEFQKKLYGKFLPSYRPVWPLEVIREICQELEMGNIYQQYFAMYEVPDSPPGNSTHPPIS